MKKVWASLLAMVMLLSLLPLGTVSVSAERPSATVQNSVVPIGIWLSIPEMAIEVLLETHIGFLVNPYTAVMSETSLLTDEYVRSWVATVNSTFGLHYTVVQMKERMEYRVALNNGYSTAYVQPNGINGAAVLTLNRVIDRYTPVVFRDSAEVAVGETVYALGYERYELQPAVIVNEGVVTQTGSFSFATTEGYSFNNLPCVVSSALITGDNVGGLLVDADGYVVGMNFAGNNTDNFAIGSRHIIALLDNLGIVYNLAHTHTYDDDYDATCNTCGAVREIVVVTLGDVNGDGRVNNKDLGLLQQHLAEWEVTLDLAAADTNGDGRVNNKDLGLLQQYLAEWDVTFG